MKPITVVELREALTSRVAPIVVDVRRADDFGQSLQTVVGALRRLPEDVVEWADEIPAGRRVVVYCKDGSEVSQAVAVHLATCGADATYLEGGIEQWYRAGAPLNA